MGMRHIVICGLSGCAVFLFSRYLINGMIFEKKEKKVIEHEMCVLSFSTTFIRNFFHYKKN